MGGTCESGKNIGNECVWIRSRSLAKCRLLFGVQFALNARQNYNWRVSNGISGLMTWTSGVIIKEFILIKGGIV